ncbi:chitosanase [Paenibacillus sp. FSL M7-1455]|uniref:chitosanase n=1 Tax=Paenibacillus sp. FSL M7-1455 TaxID=2975316 RepID=UPI0030F98694
MNNANKQATARKKLTVFLLSFTLLGSMIAMSGPVPVKAFADEQVSDAEQLEPTEISIPIETDINAELNASPSAGASEADVQAFAAAAGSHDANFSPETLQFLKANTGLDGEQWDNIMKLVNKPEQDDLNWTKYYGYCEDIGDDRGYTIGIFGATTGGPNDEGPDGPELFKEYDRAKGASNPSVEGALKRLGINGKMKNGILVISDSESKFVKKINSLQNDAAWREAMWRTFYNVYIKYSVEQAKKRGFTSALTIGSFVDTALNQGATGDSGSLQGILSRSGSSKDEKTFMTKFYAERTKIVDTNDYNQPPNGKNRVKQWSTLLNMGETDLKNADAAIQKVTDWELK